MVNAVECLRAERNHARRNELYYQLQAEDVTEESEDCMFSQN